MAKFSRLAGATSQSVNIFIQDSSSTVGAGLSGLVFNTSGLIAYYTFTGANAGSVSISLATLSTVGSAYSSGGFKEIDATNMKGLYRLDIPNAALAASKGNVVTIQLGGATNMAPCVLEIELTGWDNQSATNGGLSALPTATAGASNGLLISGTNSGTTTLGALTCTGSFTISDGLLVSRSSSNTSAITATGNGTGSGAVFTSGSGATGDGFKSVAASTNGNGVTFTHAGSGSDLNATTTPLTLAKTTNITGFNDIAATAIVSSGAITTSGGAVSTVTTVTNQLTAAAIATGVWQDSTAGDFTTANSVGKSLYNAFTSNTSVFTTASLVNAPTGGAAPTVAQIATAVWQDTTAGDFTVASSIGKSLYTSGVVPGGSGGLFIAGTNAATTVTTSFTTTFTGNLTGSVGSVTGLTASNLDTTISSRMATYTQPTGFLTATFPSGTIANTTNITAGTITTVTNLTNAATAGDLTATMKTSVTTACNAATTVGITSNRKKGAAYTQGFPGFSSSTGGLTTGLVFSATISKDGGAPVATVNSPTEIGLGEYQIVVTASEMAANNVFLIFSATGAVTFAQEVLTQP